METLLHWIGFGLCHQLPERSYFGGGVQVPVCARDTGIYVGFAVGLAILALLERGRRSSDAPPLLSGIALVGFIGMMALDGLTSYMGLRVTTNELRLFTGTLAGFALSAFTLPLLNGQLWVAPGSGRVLPTARQFGLFSLAAAGTTALVGLAGPAFGVAYPLTVGASILLTFTAVNLVIVCLLPWFERKARRLRDAWVPVGIAFGLSIIELAFSAALKNWMLVIAERVA